MASPDPVSPPRAPAYRRNPGEKCGRLLEAARAVFAERGFAGATTAQIARRAGVSEGILFHHFGSKRALFGSVARDYGRGLVAAMFGERPGSELESPAESLRRGFAYVRRHRELHRLLLLRDPAIEPAHDAVRDEIVAALAAVIGHGVERGLLRPMNVPVVAELLYSLVGGALEACFDSDDDEPYLREAIQCVTGALALPGATGTRPGAHRGVQSDAHTEE